jgi:uncharacterized repeat protein (TIGR04076 family)
VSRSPSHGERTFRLYDLRVEIVAVKPGLERVCNHRVGDYFEVSGENLSIPAGKTFSLYALAAVLPLLPAKQRFSDEHDWINVDEHVMCPDPSCEAMMRIIRTRVREFRLEDVTAAQPPQARRDDG